MTATIEAPTATSMREVAQFIHTATSADMDAIRDCLKNRVSNMRNERAAQVILGGTVTTVNLSPKYLSGLTGEVTKIEGTRAEVLLSEDSTFTAKYSDRTGKYTYGFGDAKRGTLKGVPLSCLTAE